MDRRTVLRGLGGAIGLTSLRLGGIARAAEAPLSAGLPGGVFDTAVMEALPGKRPLIRLTTRPPNYETPASYFADAITPNDAFFVRYHLAQIPRVNAATWRLDVGGEGAAAPFSLTLNELETGFEQVELAAVCQCSGNRRGFSNPHVPGVQWGSGAMGNAVWRGPRAERRARARPAPQRRRRNRLRRRGLRAAQRHAGLHQEPARWRRRTTTTRSSRSG